MKKLLIALTLLGTLSACGDFTEEEAGAMLFGAGALAICAQSGVCAFPI